MFERTLVLIKPDAVKKNIIGEILSFYEKDGLKIEQIKMVKADKETAEKHYRDHIGKSFYKELTDFIMSGPLCAVIISGDRAIVRVRKINGSTNPSKAEKGTIRHYYGTDLTKNCVHASDSIESAKREIDIWFD